jgi:hypothetical protein
MSKRRIVIVDEDASLLRLAGANHPISTPYWLPIVLTLLAFLFCAPPSAQAAATINGGTLRVATTSGSALGTPSAITVNSGGTLLLGASNQINNTASITLGGGSAPSAGALTLSATGSDLDFGTGAIGTLTFASFSPGSFSLTIDNGRGAGTDGLVFHSDQSANLSNLSFTGYGPGAVEFDLGGGFYEITPVAPVPEPSTCVAGALALGALAYHQRRRQRQRRTPGRLSGRTA